MTLSDNFRKWKCSILSWRDTIRKCNNFSGTKDVNLKKYVLEPLALAMFFIPFGKICFYKVSFLSSEGDEIEDRLDTIQVETRNKVGALFWI